MTKKAKAAYTFEEGMERAQALVEALEKGSMPLEESFDAYTQATEMLGQLKKILDAGEKRIAMLTPEGDEETVSEVQT